MTHAVGDIIRFEEERRGYRVQAASERFLVCTKPFFKTTIYTIVDLVDQVRGPENLIFGAGAETREQCEAMLARLEGRDTKRGWTTEISHRNRIPLKLKKEIK